MSALLTKKVIIIAVLVSLLLTALTYFVQLETVTFSGFIPLTMQYNVITAAASSTSTPAILFGFPFAWMLGNSAVTIVSLFAFFLDWIVFLVLSFLVLWLLLRSDKVSSYVQPKQPTTNVKKVDRK
jgi:hypothetical protein